MRRVNPQPIEMLIRRGTLPDGYEIQAGDVGKRLDMKCEFYETKPEHVGRKIWSRPYGLAMESLAAAMRRLAMRRNPGFYKTFKRSATGWDSFTRARKMTQSTGLTYEQARDECDAFNKNRTAAQIRKGTKMEFAQEGYGDRRNPRGNRYAKTTARVYKPKLGLWVDEDRDPHNTARWQAGVYRRRSATGHESDGLDSIYYALGASEHRWTFRRFRDTVSFFQMAQCKNAASGVRH